MIYKKKEIRANDSFSVVKDTAEELVAEVAEFVFKLMINHEVLKEFPVVGTIQKMYSLSQAIADHSLKKKIGSFISSFNRNAVADKDLRAFQIKMENDSRFKKATLMQILETLARLQSEQKSEILGKLFTNYLRELITWDRFVSLSVCLENIHPDSFSFLEEISNRNWEIREDSFKNRDWEKEGLLSTAGLSFSHGNFFAVHKLGQDLYEYGIKPQ